MNESVNGSCKTGHTLWVIEKGRRAEPAYPKWAAVAEIETQITFDPEILDYKGWQSVHYDLLVLSAAVEFADRRWKRPRSWSRKLSITIPVLEPMKWRQREVLDSLQAALRHLTCDDWTFTFVQWEGSSPIGSRQWVLDLGKAKGFAIAYSEGLDSRAVSALCGDADNALCIRVAKNRQGLRKGDQPFGRIPFNVNGHGSRESSFRSRGFQFSALTAIAAQLSGLTRIIVPESGQGALGPVLVPLYSIYRDYRNYPTFLRMMERFIGAVLGYSVSYEQPRLWYTKGQTLRDFLELPGKTKADLTNTRSCWQTRWSVNQSGARLQCGLCAACLLRRMSMHAAGVSESTNSYVVSDLGCFDVHEAMAPIKERPQRDIMLQYGSVGARHLQQLADMVKLQDDVLQRHSSEIARAIKRPENETLKKLKNLLANHAEEWCAFLAERGENSFLKRWTQGGRYGGSE